MSAKSTSILVSLLIVSQSTFAEKCGTPMFDRGLAPKPLFSGSVMANFEDKFYLEKDVGKVLGMIPNSYSDIFQKGQDFPAAVIDQRAKESEAFWSQEIAPEDQARFQKFHFDFGSFQELNLEADKIWRDMLACQNQDAEAARTGYFTGQLCPDKNQSARLHNDLALLNDKLYQMMASSQPWIPDDRSSEISVLGSSVDNEIRQLKRLADANPNMNLWNRGHELILPAVHPLIAQSILGLWALLLNTANESRQRFMADLPFALDEVLPEEPWKKPPPGSLPPGFELPRPPHHYKDQVYRAAIVQANALILVNSLFDPRPRDIAQKDSTCSVYGLWPAMNRTVSYFAQASYNNGLSVMSTISYSVIEKSRVACGNELRLFMDGSTGFYNRTALAHVYMLKHLFAMYTAEKLFSEFSKMPGAKDIREYTRLICEP